MSGGDFVCDNPSETPDASIPLALTEPAALLVELDTQVRTTKPVMVDQAPPPPPAGLTPAIVLILGTGPVARAILAEGGFPLELRADDANSETWCAGLARLARRADAVFAGVDWNRSPGGRDAVREAHRAGIPCFFGLESLRAWFAQRARERLPAVLEAVQRSDADELPGASPSR